MRRIALLALLVACRAYAHDFWIEPSTFRPAAGQIVTAAFRVGQKLQGEAVPLIPPLVERFVLDAAPMIAAPGRDPAGLARIAEPGLHWIGYQSLAYPVTLERAKFEEYLRDEGLDGVIRVQTQRPQAERFYRCAKALLDAGGAASRVDAPLGFTLELVPRARPRAGGELPLTLLYRGKPAANVLVVAMSKSDPEKAVRARTDAHGRVTLPIAHGGFWMIKAVHMQPAPAGSGADWESWWASLTFEL